MNRCIAVTALACLLAFPSFSQWDLKSPGVSIGSLGNSCRFDGDTDYVEVPSATALDFGTGTSFTVEMFIRRHDYGISNLINKEGPGRGWRFGIGHIDPLSHNLVPSALCAGFPGTLFVMIQNSVEIPVDDWCHVAMTVNRDVDTTKLLCADRMESTALSRCITRCRTQDWM